MILLREQDFPISGAEANDLLAQRGPDEASERPRRGGDARSNVRQGGPRAQRGALPPFPLLLVRNTLTTERRIEKVNYL